MLQSRQVLRAIQEKERASSFGGTHSDKLSAIRWISNGTQLKIYCSFRLICEKSLRVQGDFVVGVQFQFSFMVGFTMATTRKDAAAGRTYYIEDESTK